MELFGPCSVGKVGWYFLKLFAVTSCDQIDHKDRECCGAGCSASHLEWWMYKMRSALFCFILNIKRTERETRKSSSAVSKVTLCLFDGYQLRKAPKDTLGGSVGSPSPQCPTQVYNTFCFIHTWAKQAMRWNGTIPPSLQHPIMKCLPRIALLPRAPGIYKHTVNT